MPTNPGQMGEAYACEVCSSSVDLDGLHFPGDGADGSAGPRAQMPIVSVIS